MCDEEPLAAALRVEAEEFRPVQARSASGRMRRRKRHCSLLILAGREAASGELFEWP